MHVHNTATPPRRSRLRTIARLVGVLSTVAVLTAACGSDDSSGDDAPRSVEITAPADGDTVGSSFDVELGLNFDIGEPDTGRDHVHLYYDGNMAEGEYGIAYSDTFTVNDLPPGPHRIQAVVAHADHSLTDTRSAEITITVGDAGEGSAAPTTASDGDGGY